MSLHKDYCMVDILLYAHLTDVSLLTRSWHDHDKADTSKAPAGYKLTLPSQPYAATPAIPVLILPVP